VRQERETLKRLQDGLREQLGKAEVDISLERAKVARERAELEEKIRGFEADRANTPATADANGDKGKKQSGRKWLTRLGLGEGKAE
jgi:septal ring factor EnvC (AmiA/AmiB activator)